jgi:hypothetical protein
VSIGWLEYLYLRGRNNRILQNLYITQLIDAPLQQYTHSDQHGFGTASIVEKFMIKRIGWNMSEQTEQNMVLTLLQMQM